MDSTLDNGRYAVLTRIGQGGNADVYAVIDQKFHVERAVKIPRDVPQPAEARRWKQEALVMAQLNHPGIVQVFDTFEHNGRCCIVMERCHESLEERIQQNGPLDVETVLALGNRLLDVLNVAHDAGVLHRDVKPANVLFTAGGELRLGDFGVALVERDPTSLTRTGALLGTVAFMSPDTRQGKPASRESDRYGLAATMAYAVLGRLPGDVDRPSVQRTLPPEIRQAVCALLEEGSTAIVPAAHASNTPRRLVIGAVGAALLGGAFVLGRSVAPPGEPMTPTDVSALPACDMLPSHYNVNSAAGDREVVAANFMDVNQDGWPDAVFVSQADERLHVFPGGVDASLERRVDIDVGRSAVPPVMLDLDDDGVLEMVLAERDDAQLRVLWLDAHLNTTKTQLFEQAGPMEEPQAIDIDGDGRLDLVGRIDFGARVIWRRVPGDGTLEPMRYLLNASGVTIHQMIGMDVIVEREGQWSWCQLSTQGELSCGDVLQHGVRLHQLPDRIIVRSDDYFIPAFTGDQPCTQQDLLKWRHRGGKLSIQLADWNADGVVDWLGAKTCRNCTSELIVARGL